jgi:hypothetical protein
MSVNELLFTIVGSLAGIYAIYLAFMWTLRNPASSLMLLFYFYAMAIIFFGRKK